MDENREDASPQRLVRDRFPALYTQLRAVAARVLEARRSPSQEPSDLLHEAFVKMRDEESRRAAADRSLLGDKPDDAFKACFGAACRDILVDRVRRRVAKKRGSGRPADDVDDASVVVPGQGPVDALVASDAIAALAGFDPQLAQLVEARVFGDLSVPECAELFAMSPRTVDRRWAFAVAWLRERLQ